MSEKKGTIIEAFDGSEVVMLTGGYQIRITCGDKPHFLEKAKKKKILENIVEAIKKHMDLWNVDPSPEQSEEQSATLDAITFSFPIPGIPEENLKERHFFPSQIKVSILPNKAGDFGGLPQIVTDAMTEVCKLSANWTVPEIVVPSTMNKETQTDLKTKLIGGKSENSIGRYTKYCAIIPRGTLSHVVDVDGKWVKLQKHMHEDIHFPITIHCDNTDYSDLKQRQTLDLQISSALAKRDMFEIKCREISKPIIGIMEFKAERQNEQCVVTVHTYVPSFDTVPSVIASAIWEETELALRPSSTPQEEVSLSNYLVVGVMAAGILYKKVPVIQNLTNAVARAGYSFVQTITGSQERRTAETQR